MYQIPKNILDEFLKVATKNLSTEDNGLVETLAYLVGYEENGELHMTELIFPKQNGSESLVIDEGNSTLYLYFRITQCFSAASWSFGRSLEHVFKNNY